MGSQVQGPERVSNSSHPSGDIDPHGMYPSSDGTSILTTHQDILEPIAVIGLSFKFPQDAVTPASFWKMLVEKRCAMTEWPGDRLNIDAFYHPDKNKSSSLYNRGGNFMQGDLAAFDASFFSITAEEATAMDPQHRFLLEATYRALENAGISLEQASGTRTAVYTGSMADDYRSISAKSLDDMQKYAATGASMSLLANRLSWFFNFRGPSINLDSACSSSFMALDIACQGLRNNDSSMAVVAGTSLIYALESWISLSKMGFLSPDSRCYSFDSRANGYARGEGFGVVVVKRISDAIRDGDTIRAVIRSTSSNSDGRTPGITQPSREAQENLIRETYLKAGLDLETTRFFEAHGTGTLIGDPIEADAIGKVFRVHRSPEDPLYIGALKSNIGHLEGGSGIAGLIKTILVLEKGVIPPNTNFVDINPKIDADFSNLKFPTEPTPWPCKGLRRASVNSFGFGGSNSHCVLEDAHHFLQARLLDGNHCSVKDPPTLGEITTVSDDKVEHTAHRASIPRLFVWSSSEEGGIQRLAEIYSRFFKESDQVPCDVLQYMSDLAFILAYKRSSLAWKGFAVLDCLSGFQHLKRYMSKATRSSNATNAAYIFTGQGAQYSQMGISLRSFAVFEDSLRMSDESFRKLGCSWSLFEELQRENDESQIDNPAYSQPLCTALQIALVDLLRQFGILPSAVVGHSSGEIAAAYAIGGLSQGSACKVAYFRGKLAHALRISSETRPGAMMSVNISEEDVKAQLNKIANLRDPHDIVVACINSPQNVTLSGSEADIDTIQCQFNADGIFAHKLHTGVAYHSPEMKSISEKYAAAIQGLQSGTKPSQPVVMISSVTGGVVEDIRTLSTDLYWVNNMVQPVRFSAAMAKLLSSTKSASKNKLGAVRTQRAIYDVIEIGPHSALQRPIKDIKTSLKLHNLRYHSVLSKLKCPLVSTLGVVGQLHSLGYSVDLREVNQIETYRPSEGKAICDLPEYPFNHARTYWHEHWTSRDVRLGEYPSLDLLGTSANDWNPLEARWLKVFDMLQTPWIEHHKVNGKVIYPAAGMMVMVLEGAKQIAPRHRAIKGFRLKDTLVSIPITIADHGSKQETQLYMRPLQNAFDKDCPSSEFRICIHDKGIWKEVGKGIIQTEYESDDKEVDGGRENQVSKEALMLKLRNATMECNQAVPKDQVYEWFRKMGLDLGPPFQALEEIYSDGENVAVADVKTFDWAAYENLEAVQRHTIHPTTLDGALQLTLVCLTKGCTTKIQTLIPTRIKSAWISASGLSYSEARTLKVYCTASFKSPNKAETTSFALDELGNLKIAVSNLESSVVSSNEQVSYGTEARRLCYYMDSMPDVSLLQPEQLSAICKSPPVLDQEPKTFFEDLDSLSSYFMIQFLQEVQDEDIRNPFQKYIKSIKRHVQMRGTQSECTDVSSQIGSLIGKMEGNVVGRTHIAVGRNLLAMVRGQIDPLELLFSGDLAEGYYRDICERGTYCKDIGDYLDLLAHKNPGMKVLEIGAGKGSFTNFVLRTLLCHDSAGRFTDRIFSYDYTDISESFFEKAREKFLPMTERISFKVLNIENDPSLQDFELHSYDLVVAHSVIHATRELDKSLQNCRKLLKPGGKLILLEVTRPELMRTGFVFGTLPGWWLSTEKYREWGPCIPEALWNTGLIRNGFSGVEFSIQDYASSSSHEFSLFVTTANPEVTPEPQHQELRIVMVIDSNSYMQADLSQSIRESLESSTNLIIETVPTSELVSVKESESTFFIFLPELDNAFLYDMSPSKFDQLQKIAKIAQRLLWITKGPRASDISPKLRMIDGFARVLRSETNSRVLVTLDFQDDQVDQNVLIKTIIKVLGLSMLKTAGNDDMEYVHRDGMLFISRVKEAKELDQIIHSSVHPQIRDTLVQEAGAVELAVEKPGLLESLYFTPDLEHEKELKLDEVEIKVQYVGLNFRDLLVALGRHNESSLGCECSGIITRVGNNCKSLKAGDRVCVAKIGCMSTYVRTHTDLAFKIPEEMPTMEAAACLIAGSTVYYSLIQIANLQRGESVLIHSASGATGQMAIQLAQHLGCEIFVTVGYDEKKDLLKTLYNIPDDHVFYSRNLVFATSIMRMTSGRGVDVVLNSLSSDALVASWEVVAPYGRFIELGKVDIESNSKLPMASFAKNVLFAAVAIDNLIRERPKAFQKTVLSILDLFNRRILRSVEPIHTLPISRVQEGLRLMQSGKSSGKIVFDVNETSLIPALIVSKSTWKFESAATYVIAGGLGGLGRSTAFWMASRGARNLILLSRSGAVSDAALQLLDRLTNMGVRARAPKCDVSSVEDLSRVIAECTEQMPPIKGCIQGAMALRDALFEKMTFDEWSTTISSKAYSSWNLHNLLPSNLSFFILLSSIAGVGGTIGQTNYAAGNTFQDALCLHRISSGQRAVCLRLGIMADIGIISESDKYFKTRDRLVDMAAVMEAEYLSLLEHYCDPEMESLTPQKSLPMVGLMTPAQLESQGVEVPFWLQQPTFSPLAQIGLKTMSSSPKTAGTRDFASEIRGAGSIEDVIQVVLQAVTSRLSRALAVPVDDIDGSQPLHAYGVDSLLAVEMRNWLKRELGADLAVFDIMGAESILGMSKDVATKSTLVVVAE